MIKNKELRALVLIFFYLLVTVSSLLYKIEWFNQFDWGLNYEYWETNTEYLSGVIFWLNLFLFSLAPVLVTRYFTFNNKASWVALCLPLYWFYYLFLQVVNQSGDGGWAITAKFSEFVYAIVMLGTVVVGIQVIYLTRSLRKQNNLETLNKFKDRALKKLYLLNPQINENLLQDVLGEHGEALNLLMAANLEENEYKKQRLIKLALNEVSRSKNSLDELQKKLLRISTFSNLRKSPA